MNTRPTRGILSPRDRGHAIAAILQQHGLRVLTNIQGCTARTVGLADQTGIIDGANDRVLVCVADILFSILVAHEAVGDKDRGKI